MSVNSTQAQVYLQLSDRVFLSNDSTLDFSLVQIININSTDNATSIRLGNVNYGRILKVFGGAVQINGEIKLADPASTTIKQQSFFVVVANSIYIGSNASISAGYVLLQADSVVETALGSKVTSYITNTCNLDK